jgi:hypothetical protein
VSATGMASCPGGDRVSPGGRAQPAVAHTRGELPLAVQMFPNWHPGRSRLSRRYPGPALPWDDGTGVSQAADSETGG